MSASRRKPLLAPSLEVASKSDVTLTPIRLTSAGGHPLTTRV